MAYNFPNTPNNGDRFTPVGGPTYVWKASVPAWMVEITPYNPRTAQARNRLVNPAMQISQENGNAASAASSYYPADQFMTFFVTTGAIGSDRYPAVTPNGSKYRLRVNVNTADASLAAGESAMVLTRIEGVRVADFGYGTAAARQAILRFGFLSTVAGTFAISLRNSAYNRSYVALFTITAGQVNTDTTQTFVIPGDVTGTWLTDTGVGIEVNIVLAAGSTYQGAGGWQAGYFFGTSAMTNNLAATASFQIFDVGLYLDDQNTGVPPPWVMPDEADELGACERYWQKSVGYMSGNVTASAAYYCSYQPHTMPRPGFALSGGNNANGSFPATVGTYTAFATGQAVESRTANATGGGVFGSVLTFNGRM